MSASSNLPVIASSRRLRRCPGRIEIQKFVFETGQSICRFLLHAVAVLLAAAVLSPAVVGSTPSSSEPPSANEGLAITNLTATPFDEVPLFGKLEITFDIVNSIATSMYWPYDPSPPSGVPRGSGISVEAVFIDPGGREFVQPGFYYEGFLSDVRNATDWHYPTGRFVWKIRFSPNRTGEWRYRIVARDDSGTVESQLSTITVSPAATRGFVKVSSSDRRYFEFDDGSLFDGAGYQLHGVLENPVAEGTSEFLKLRQAGVNFVRLWISPLFGSAWNPYVGGRNQYRGYLPVTGLLPVYDELTGRSNLAMHMDMEEDGDRGWFEACRLQWSDDLEAVKPNTTYRIHASYMGQGITGPRDPTYPDYGFVIKLGGWHSDCYRPATSQPVTGYGLASSGWEQVEGSWYSGDNNFLPRMHLALENVQEGGVDIRSISVREELGNGQYGPEILLRPSMQYDEYIPQEKAYSFDRIVESAAANGVYLKLVVMEKEDKLWYKLADSGQYVSGEDNADGFYGLGRVVNRTRWLQQAWWRYLQARWGYSSHIHSWELINEGDPASTAHYELADEFGEFMHYRVFGVDPSSAGSPTAGYDHPNDHLVTTSFWHSVPATAFWANSAYPNVDYVDIHAYISTGQAPEEAKVAMQWDAAYYHIWLTEKVAGMGIGKPVVRGEAGLDAPDDQNESVLGVPHDVAGIWLHNFLWSGLHSGALYELYWWTSHIWNDSYDHRPQYLRFRRFLGDIPLNRGGYADWSGSVSTPLIRVVGQKNTVLGEAHLWIQNRNHTWKSVVDKRTIAPVSGIVTVPGLLPDTKYRLELWNTDSDARHPVDSQELVADRNGYLAIPVTNLVTDYAVKIRVARDAAGSRRRSAPTIYPRSGGIRRP